MGCPPPSAWERLGGEPGVRAILADLVGRVSRDFIVGYLFAGKDLDRIIQHEVELASTHLGGSLAYRGRNLAHAHAASRINRGHFRRRMAFLRKVLEEHGVPADIAEAWLAHDQRMEATVTDGLDCAPEAT